jgi:predicted protein tyrosine phosphatase
MKRVLFVCSQNRLRSPTAEQVFAGNAGVDCASAGTDHDADNPLTPELIEWAEIIFVMEKTHRNKLLSRFRRYLATVNLFFAMLLRWMTLFPRSFALNATRLGGGMVLSRAKLEASERFWSQLLETRRGCTCPAAAA